MPRDPSLAERPLYDLSRFLVALGVALDSVANRVPLMFTEGEVSRWSERSENETLRIHANVERLAWQAQKLGREGSDLSSRAHLDDFVNRVRALLDGLEAELVEVAEARPRAKSVA